MTHDDAGQASDAEAGVGSLAGIALALFLLAAVFGLVTVQDASAYSTPSGLTPSNYSTLCPPRPSDGGGSVAIDGNQTLASASGSTATFNASAPTAGGPGFFAFYTSQATSSLNYNVDVQDSGGAWHVIATWSSAAGSNAGGGNGNLANFQLPSVPSGNLRVRIVNYSGGTPLVSVVATIGNPQSGTVTLQQEIADTCYRDEQRWSANHSDLGAIQSAVSGLGGGKSIADVNATETANGQVLAALDGDLRQLDTDVKANGAGGSGGSGTVSGSGDGTPVPVHDQQAQLAADGVGQSMHGDLWVLVGVIVACFVFHEVLRKVWP